MCIDVNNNHLNIATVTKLVQRLQKGKAVETQNVSRLSSKKYYIQIFRHSCFEKRLEKDVTAISPNTTTAYANQWPLKYKTKTLFETKTIGNS